MAHSESVEETVFELSVPYKLIDTGADTSKPLIVYLHGFKQNLEYFEKRCSNLKNLEAYHLFIQGPYPVYDENHTRNVARWGRAWYLYDGEQEQFIRSLEKTSVFIERLITEISSGLKVNRTAVVGYSMGGYLAGYYSLSRPADVNDMVVIGGRIKTELFTGHTFDGMNVLHLHGSHDRSVEAARSQESCEQLRAMGAAVTFKELQSGHKLTEPYIHYVKEWMLALEYAIVKEEEAL